MNWLKRFRNIFILPGESPIAVRSADSAQTYSPRTGSVVPIAGGGNPLAVAAVYQCVRLISESVASLPLMVKRYNDSVYQESKSDALWRILNVEPEPGLSAFDFWASVVRYVLLCGNAYAVPVRGYDMEISRLALVNPNAVGHDCDHDRYQIDDSRAGISGLFDEWEVIHIKGMGPDPKNGLSVLSQARTTLQIAQTGARETLKRFETGGAIRGVLSNDRSIKGFGKNQDQQLQFAAEDLDEKLDGGQRIVHLPGTIEFKQFSMSSADMQFLETQKFTVRDICRFFGVHPSFVFDDTSNNYKSAENASADFLSKTLNPLLRKIECELLRKLVPADYQRYRKFEFDRRAVFACDLDSKMRYNKQLIETGLATINELRRSEDRPAVEGGDAPLASANLKTLSELAGNAQNPAKTDNSDENQ